jgi:hypothetical protein
MKNRENSDRFPREALLFGVEESVLSFSLLWVHTKSGVVLFDLNLIGSAGGLLQRACHFLAIAWGDFPTYMNRGKLR